MLIVATATIRGGNIHDIAILPSAFRAKRVVNLQPRIPFAPATWPG